MEYWGHSRIISHKDGKTEISQARGKQQLREAAQEDQEEEHMRARLEVYHTTRITGVNASRKGAVLWYTDTRRARHLIQVISAAAGTLDQKLTRLTRMYQAVGFCLSRRWLQVFR